MNIQRRAKLETTITLDADEWFDFQTGKAGVYFVVKQVCLLSNGDVRMHGQITGGQPGDPNHLPGRDHRPASRQHRPSA